MTDPTVSETDDAPEAVEAPAWYQPYWRWVVDHWAGLTSAAIVIACCGAVFLTLQPRFIFMNTTTAGGDTGAHVWWPAYLRDTLLPSGRIAGWSKDYYAGFPAGQFYFPVPALMIVALNVVLPYNIAFKIVTAIGGIMLPACAYVFGRSLKIRFPGPAFMAVGTLGLLFFTGDPRGSGGNKTANALDYATAAFNQRIMGGNLASMLAGEFSFSIALCFALLFLGVFFMTLRGNKRPGWAALLLAATVMSHLVVGIFVGVAALTVLAFRLIGDARRTKGAVAGGLLLLTLLVAVSTISPVWTALFAVPTAAAIIWFAIGDTDRVWLIAGGVGGVGALLTGVWTLPLVARFPYTSNMRYEKLVDVPTTAGNEILDLYLLPRHGIQGIFPLAFLLGLLALVVAIIMWRGQPILIGTFTAFMGILFVQWPEAHAWNLRFLPFWYLGWLLLAGLGLAELLRLPIVAAGLLSKYAERRARQQPDPALTGPVPDPEERVDAVPAPNPAHAATPMVDDETLAENRRELEITGNYVTATMAVVLAAFLCIFAYNSQNNGNGFLSFWAEYNYSGYEWVAPNTGTSVNAEIAKAKGPCNIPAHFSDEHARRSAKAYPEFQSIMQTMGKLPPGRALWEPSAAIDKYGTTLALELLPYCTNGRIGSMEGLYFEAAGTTAYHFITVSELAKQPSNPMRFPPEWNAYGSLADFDRGVRHMQDLGVRYYMAQSDEAKKKAAASADLRFVTDIADTDNLDPKGWQVYEVKDAPTVEGLRYAPVVVTGLKPADWQQSGNKTTGNRWLIDWFNNPQNLDRPLVDGGPSSWARATRQDAASTALGEPLPAVAVTNIRERQMSVSFDVDRVGVPVLVKTSYYPAWRVSGAKGVYRASPNFMVVIPTSNHVELTFARTASDWLGILSTLVGLALLVPMFLWLPPRMTELTAPEDSESPDADADADADADGELVSAVGPETAVDAETSPSPDSEPGNPDA